MGAPVTLSERILSYADSLAVFALTSIGGGIAWLIRRVFTNQKQIEMLSAEIRNRDELRGRDSERISELHKDVRELRSHVMGLDK
jgi:hypothetical protein